MLSKITFKMWLIYATFLFAPSLLSAQSSSNNISLIGALIVIGALILVGAIVTLSESLLQIEAKKHGVSGEKASLFPSFSELFGKKLPSYTEGQGAYVLDKGYDINLAGKPSADVFKKPVSTYAVRPQNFRGIAPIPKLVVAEKDEVLAGDVLFYDKSNPDIKYCSPVSGEVIEIKRGAKRAITEVIILSDKKQAYKENNVPDLGKANREELVEFMMGAGVWPLINERPYDVVPDPDKVPTNIFVSSFDTAPLAPSTDVIMDGNESAFQKGVDVLAQLTSGVVHIGLSANGENKPSAALTGVKNAETHYFSGKHPAGNVGVQIHHISPIKAGQSVWTVSLQNVIAIGRLFSKGQFDLSRIIAIGGNIEGKQAHYDTIAGAKLGDLLGDFDDADKRIISGDVLTGRKVSKDDFLDMNADQISVVDEGDYYEMFGWLLPIAPRPSISKTFPAFLMPSLEMNGDTNTHGEKRAFVVTGQYEQVLPMDIYPQHLIKAIMTGDFEQMEGLGIYEMSEEDIALCEFVCTSKMPLQSILREGLDMMREQS